LSACSYDLGDHNTNSIAWNVTLIAGQSVVFSVQDNAGKEDWTGSVSVPTPPSPYFKLTFSSHPKMIVGASNDVACLPANERANATAADSAAEGFDFCHLSIFFFVMLIFHSQFIHSRCPAINDEWRSRRWSRQRRSRSSAQLRQTQHPHQPLRPVHYHPIWHRLCLLVNDTHIRTPTFLSGMISTILFLIFIVVVPGMQTVCSVPIPSASDVVWGV
jgi:hypothetical protein